MQSSPAMTGGPPNPARPVIPDLIRHPGNGRAKFGTDPVQEVRLSPKGPPQRIFLSSNVCAMFFPIANRRDTKEGMDMPTKKRSILSRLARALPVVLAAAPGVIDAIQQTRRALREPAAPPRDPALPPA